MAAGVVMHLVDARDMAMELMRRHGLAGWRFRFDHARRRFGSCRWGEKTITLSRPLTILNSEAEVRDTVLHEIAHALTPGDGHGARWKAACVRVGARPVRCYTEKDVVAPPRKPAPLLLGCLACDWWVDRRRIDDRQRICKICRGDVVYREKATGQTFTVARRRS